MTVTAVYAAVIGGGREEALDAGDELDGGAKLESHHCGEVGLGEPGQAGAVYQVIGEYLRNKTISGLSQKHSELGCHLGIVLTVVNFRDELCHLLHRPVGQISRSRACVLFPSDLGFSLSTLVSLFSFLSVRSRGSSFGLLSLSMLLLLTVVLTLGLVSLATEVRKGLKRERPGREKAAGKGEP